MAFLKQASIKIENPEVSVDSWVGNKFSKVRTAAGDKVVEYKKIIADFDPSNYLLTHCTIVASVDVEDAPKPVHFGSEKTRKEYDKLEGRSDYFITPDTAKYVNANGDAWGRELLKKSYKTFIGAQNYVEHVQDPTLSKDKILDAVIREVDSNKSVFVDILVATDKKHKDLVGKIKTGELTTLSMGSIVAFTVCTECGRVASDETELCHHIKFFKRNKFISENDGKQRPIAELCGHFLYPESNEFIEGSWVETPAFKGAVMRNEIEVDELDKVAFVEQYAPVMQIKSPDLQKTAARIMAAFSLVDRLQNDKTAFYTEAEPEEDKTDEEVPVEEDKKEEKEPSESVPMKDPIPPEGDELPEDEETPAEPVEEAPEDLEAPTEEEPVDEAPADEAPADEAPADEDPTEEEPTEGEPADEAPADEPAEDPVEDPPKDEEPADENPNEDAPPTEDSPEEDVPAELEDMGDEKVDEEEAEKDSKKPYDEIKEEIKKNLRDEIKKEILLDLGIDVGGTPSAPSLDGVNLNDSLVRAKIAKDKLSKLKLASKIMMEKGLKELFKYGCSRTDTLKIAMISDKYSINKDLFKIVDKIDNASFSTRRRYAKAVEKKLGRDLTLEERVGLDLLLNDLE